MRDPRELHPDSATNDGDLEAEKRGSDVPKYMILGMQGRVVQIKRGQGVVNPRDSRAHEKHRARQPVIRVMRMF